MGVIMNKFKHRKLLLVAGVILISAQVVNAAAAAGNNQEIDELRALRATQHERWMRAQAGNQAQQAEQPQEVRRVINPVTLQHNEIPNPRSESCPICLETIATDIQVITLACKHKCDIDCLFEWLQVTLACPLCRAAIDFTTINLTQEYVEALTRHWSQEAKDHRQAVKDLDEFRDLLHVIDLNDNNGNPEGRTILAANCLEGNLDRVQIILAHQADGPQNPLNINAFNVDRSTALHSAVEGNHDAIVQLLLAHGALVNRTNNRGQSVLDIALNNGNVAIAQRLMNAGARVNLINTIRYKYLTTVKPKIQQALTWMGLNRTPLTIGLASIVATVSLGRLMFARYKK
jgi:hypothetical protein